MAQSERGFSSYGDFHQHWWTFPSYADTHDSKILGRPQRYMVDDYISLCAGERITPTLKRLRGQWLSPREVCEFNAGIQAREVDSQEGE